MKRTLVIATLVGGLTLGTSATAHSGAPGHWHVVVVPAPHVDVTPAPRIVRPAAPYCVTYMCSGSVIGPQGETATFNRLISR